MRTVPCGRGVVTGTKSLRACGMFLASHCYLSYPYWIPPGTDGENLYYGGVFYEKKRLFLKGSAHLLDDVRSKHSFGQISCL